MEDSCAEFDGYEFGNVSAPTSRKEFFVFMDKLLRLLMVTLVVTGIIFSHASFTQADEVDDAISSAVAYLKGQTVTPDITMALVAAGESVDVAYLKDFFGDTAISYAKPMLALTAAGKDPRLFPDEDWVAKMKSFADDTQLGSPDQVNDDIWGILALISAGVSTDDSVVQKSKSFVLSNQNSDGGWAWNTGGPSDTNDTAVAIMALLETGISRSDTVIQNAISYLKAAQNDDGGFPYDPVSIFGTDSDANSGAWVIMAINKVEGDPASWTNKNNNPVGHLLSLQDTDGGFWWMEPPADFNNKGATADAVIALTGNSYPIGTTSSGGLGEAEVSFRIEGSTAQICKGAVEASTAMDVVINAADECGYAYVIQETSFGSYLSQINDDAAKGLSGWLYRVNFILPSIGAADYVLTREDTVLWYYGEFEEEGVIDTSDKVELSVEVVEDSSSGGGDGGTPEAGFSVSPSLLDFGKLEPGGNVVQQVTLRNEGTKDLRIRASIEGNPVFNFLTIVNMVWSLFETFLNVGATVEVELNLSIPVEYSFFGSKTGTIIFWGQSAP